MGKRPADDLKQFASTKEQIEYLRQQNTHLTRQLQRSQAAQAENARLRKEVAEKGRELETMLGLQRPIDTYTIKPTASKRVGEATLFWVASDWHVEEVVQSAAVNGLNSYDLNESKRRADLFFTRGLRLMRMFQQDVAIPKIVMPLMGDFISGSIHEDLAESNLLPPTDAALRWVEYVTSGLEMVLDETKKDGTLIYCPCHTGNHGRMTKERRVQTEAGNSLERMMYAHLKAHFRNEERITFNISTAYHSFVHCYDLLIRFHHGHLINYGGGVGGITIPVNKAIAQWNKARKADLDVFGHFHQHIDGGNFVSNGSLIGWNTFAISIKASFEPPQQALFLIDKKFGRKTISAPIMFD